MIIGGAEDKVRKPTILKHFVALSGGKDARIAVIPTAVSAWLHIPPQISAFLGGTGLLIVVSVALDMVQRIEANLLMRNYGGFLGGPGHKGKRIKGRQY